MDFTAKIIAKDCDADKLVQCLAPEEKSFERSTFTITKKDNNVEIDITTTDAVALRATVNSISQLLIVYEGAKKE
ncbi:KEOPS complex subunit Pcc1 [Nanoarchaeota archaeon]